MNQQHLPCFILSLLCLFSSTLSAQITFERSDYTREADVPIASWNVLPTSLTIPSEGANQIWDYSNIELTTAYSYTGTAGTHPDFPTANFVITDSATALSVPIALTFLEVLDNEQYATIGRISSANASSLAAFTGNPMDSLALLESVNVYQEPLYYYQFPVNYEDSWSANISLTTNAIATVGLLGLDHVPLETVTYVDRTTTVVGYGTLILPNLKDTNSINPTPISQEVLLLKTEEMTIDSFFTAGEPSPAIQLLPFGLTQGVVNKGTTYSFTAKNLPRNALGFWVVNDTIRGGSMSNDIGNATTPNHFIEKHLEKLTVFPNPAKGTFQLDFEKTDGQTWRVEVFNALGQFLQQQTVASATGPVSIKVELPAIHSGMHRLLIRNGVGEVVGMSKILIE